MKIRYLKNGEINYYRWDNCIKNSFNSSIYGYSWYLNTVCKNWDALIEGDYEAVMPLPIVKKFGLRGIKTPYFISSLGIFSTKLISTEKVETFFRSIPSGFLFINLAINKFNKVNWKSPVVVQESHYELDLIKPYNKISRGYNQSLKEVLVRTGKLELSFLKGISPNDLLELVKDGAKEGILPGYGEEKIKILRMLLSASLRFKIGELAGVYNSYNNLVSAAFFIWSGNNVILLFCHTTDEGIREDAFCFLIDHFIQLYSNRFITLIFEYSESPGLNEIYKLFGAIGSQYQHITKKRLPFISSFPGSV